LDLSDNFSAVALLARGRTAFYQLNQVLRQNAALEAATETRMRTVWVDTLHMPADSGTRPDLCGVLHIGRVEFKQRCIVILVCALSNSLIVSVNRMIETVDVWSWSGGEHGRVALRTVARNLFRLLESGTVLLVWWSPPVVRSQEKTTPGTTQHSFPLETPGSEHLLSSALRRVGSSRCAGTGARAGTGASWSHGELIGIGLVVAHSAGTAGVVEGSASADIWKELPLQRGLTSILATTVSLDFCGFGDTRRRRTRLAGTLRGLALLGRRCVGQRRCTYTGLAHSRGDDGGCGQSGDQGGDLGYPVGLADAVAALVADAAATGGCLDTVSA
jgi:hypothetical protein